MDDIFQLNGRKLGFGLMRLPKDENGEIDTRKTIEMVDRFISEGFSYFDAAYSYPGAEEAFKAAVTSRYPRDSYTLASKMSSGLLSDDLPPEKMFASQLERTGLDYIDFYLLHAVQKENLHIFEKYDAWNFGKNLKKDGRIRHFGFSFHDSPELLDELLAEHPEVEFVQLQINYLDWTNPTVQSKGIYEVARKHQKPIVIMEPVKGGLLSNLQDSITAPFGDATPASMALRFASGLDGILAVLSGMSTPEQLEENMRIFSPCEKLSEKELKAVETVKERIEEMQAIQCTSCRYCVSGCPEKIAIPDIFKLLNEEAISNRKENIKARYYAMIENGKSGEASSCIRCGKCEKTCPQKLPIRELLRSVETRLA
ncbi:MAG: aldo/keto reductase [Spirochaetes bacterium]|uniref:Aldo/keto reductase n=1 Tax=Candidatus Ornithospirochaeta stercoripullorum TaxID=2840899 RepID=A0A9D9E521_9SPIO|nr:aldo/keto reductase [Candidatus Ornithospirochaeta stercoripullorum]